jgi:glycogen synthase
VRLELMAHGCPVIACGVGGAAESVTDGTTGVPFEQQTVNCLASAIRGAETTALKNIAMHAHTQRFRRMRFLGGMRQALVQALGRAD